MDSYRSVLNRFDKTIASWDSRNYLAFAVILLKKILRIKSLHGRGRTKLEIIGINLFQEIFVLYLKWNCFSRIYDKPYFTMSFLGGVRVGDLP